MIFETLCDECKVKPAYRRVLDTSSNSKRYIYLCRDCYYKRQKNATIKLMDNLAQKTVVHFNSTSQQAICANCKTTESEFLKTGILGCENCYMYLSRSILDMIKSAQRGYIHKGKSPYDAVNVDGVGKCNIEIHLKKEKEYQKPEVLSEQQRLKNKLEKAVSEEDFELACKIRDEIKILDEKENINAGVDE